MAGGWRSLPDQVALASEAGQFLSLPAQPLVERLGLQYALRARRFDRLGAKPRTPVRSTTPNFPLGRRRNRRDGWSTPNRPAGTAAELLELPAG